METKHKFLHFLLVSVLWVAVVMAVTRGTHPGRHGVGDNGFTGAPDFVQETVQDANTLISMNLQ